MREIHKDLNIVYYVLYMQFVYYVLYMQFPYLQYYVALK